MKTLHLLVILLIGSLQSLRGQEVIEPVKSKKALVYLPFESDLRKDRSLIDGMVTKLRENYEVTILDESNTVFDETVFNNYILRLNEYDFIYFGSHGGSKTISLGIPVLQESGDISKYRGVLDDRGVQTKRSDIIKNSLAFQRYPDGKTSYRCYAITPAFFLNHFTGAKKFRNAVFISDSCHNAEENLAAAFTHSTVGGASFSSWKGLSRAIYSKETTFPYVLALASGKDVNSGLVGIPQSHTRTWTDTVTNHFGLGQDLIAKSETSTFHMVKPDRFKDFQVALYNAKNTVLLASDLNWFLFDGLTDDQKTLTMNTVNSVHGPASKSKRVKIYEGHGGAFLSSFPRYAAALNAVLNTQGLVAEYSSEEPINTHGYRAIFILPPGRNTPNYFSSSEVASLRTFVQNGGKLVLIAEHNKPNSEFHPDKATYNKLVADLGIEVSNEKAFGEPMITDLSTASIFAGFLKTELFFNWYSWFTITGNQTDNRALAKNPDGKPVLIEAKID